MWLKLRLGVKVKDGSVLDVIGLSKIMLMVRSLEGLQGAFFFSSRLSVSLSMILGPKLCVYSGLQKDAN